MSEAVIAQDFERYAFLQRLFHWLIALLVLGSLAGGAMLYAYGFEGLRDTFGLEMTNTIYKYHKTAGVMILGLMVLRILLRLAYGHPPRPSTMSSGTYGLARATHLALYALLIVMPVLGWAATAAGGFPVQFFDLNLPPIIGKNEALSGTLFTLHGIVGVVIGVLVLIHIAAALRHWLILKDGVMQRIGLP